MPPEQALGNWDQVDARTDLWAAGATLWNLLTNRLVHEANTINKLLLAAMTCPAAPIRTLRPDTPPWLAAVIDRALAFDAKDRWQTARDFRRALQTGPLAVAAITQQSVSWIESAPAASPAPIAVHPSPVIESVPVAPFVASEPLSPAITPPQLLSGFSHTASPVSSDREPPTLRRQRARATRVWVAVLMGAACAVGVVVAGVLWFGRGNTAPPISPLSSSSVAATSIASRDGESSADAAVESLAPSASVTTADRLPTTPPGKSPPAKTTEVRVPPRTTGATPAHSKTGDPLGKY
jgi:serine/threonine-protein kinase